MKINILGLRGFPQIQGGVEKHCEMLYTSMEPLDAEFNVYRRKPYVTPDNTQTYLKIRFKDTASGRHKGLEPFVHTMLAAIMTVFDRPDIAHFHNIGPGLFTFIPRMFGIKTVMTYHSPNYEHDKWGWFAKHLLLFGEWMSFHCCSKIIYVNKFQMEKMPAKFRYKGVYIPNGIPTVTKSTKTDYIEELGLEPQKYVLSVGRITPEKGFDILVNAFAQLDTHTKLVIAGGVETESSYLNELKQMISQDKIVYTGFVQGERLNQLYTNARLYVLASRNEGFPLVLLEAMAYGLDVIVSDIPATHLVDLPSTDYFVRGNIDALKARLREKLNAPIEKPIYDLREFNWKTIGEKTYEVYQKIFKC